jgi:peptidyl-prolyl cis-trans isomerase C
VLALALAAFAATACAQAVDTVLVANSVAKVTKADYDAQLLKLPADLREGFGNNPKRVAELLQNMLVQKSMAAKARTEKLDAKPEVATRLALEHDYQLAAIEAETIQQAAAAEFDANIARYETRAREIYLVDKARFTNPPQVSATHILFDTRKHSSEEAKKLAEDARARIVAGADMSQLAKQVSDDPSSSQNNGQLGWFSQKDMDPAFGAAAFALDKVGDVSQPVQSQFGWHVIRLDGKRPSSVKTYEEAKPAIIAELRTKYMQDKLDEVLNGYKRAPVIVNNEAVLALTPRVDPDTVKRAQEAALPPK